MSETKYIPGDVSNAPRAEYSAKVGIVGVASRLEQRARELGEAKMTESEKDSSGINGGIRRLWRHNLLREYYRQVEISKARQRVPGRVDSTTGVNLEKLARVAANEAILNRFTSLDEFNITTLLHEEAGEQVHLNRDTVKEALIKKQLTNFIRDFAAGKFDETEFNKRKGLFINEAIKLDPKMLAGLESFADNLLPIGLEVRRIVDAGVAVENIDIDLEITLGRARAGARTETEFNRVDRVMEMVSRSPLRPFGRSISKALGLMSSVHSFVTGGFIGGYEKERIKNERKLHERQRASGLTFDKESDSRRNELEQSGLEKVSAKTLTDDLNRASESLTNNVTPETVRDAVTVWAEAEARVRISDSKKIDLLSYADSAVNEVERQILIEEERTELDLARASLEAHLANTFYGSDLSDEELTKLIPPAFRNLEEFMLKIVEVQKSRFTDPENGEIVRQNRLVRKLSGYQFLWFRKPLGEAMTQKQIDAKIEARRGVDLPPRTSPPTITENEPPVVPPVDTTRPPEPVDTEPVPDADVEPFFEVTGSLAEFKNKTGVEYTSAQVKALYGEYAKTGRFDLVADLRRGTGVALNKLEMQDLIAELDFSGRSSLISAIPESAALIPWSESLRRIEDRLPHSDNPEQDPWRNEVAPMVNTMIAEGLLNIEKKEDGELVALFFAEGYGMYHTPELMRAWINLKRTANVADLPPAEISKITEWLGAEYETKTSAEVLDEIGLRFSDERTSLGESEPITVDASVIGNEIQVAFERKRRDIMNEPELVGTIKGLKIGLKIAEKNTSVQLFGALKPMIASSLKFEISRVEAMIGVDKKLDTQLRGKIYAMQQQMDRFNALVVPTDEQPASIRNFIEGLSQLDIKSPNVDALIATSYFKVYAIEHPKLYEKLKTAVNGADLDQLTYEQLKALTVVIIDKIVREDLPKKFKSGPSYYALLRAFKAENPNENPLAIANDKMDEIFGISSSRKRLPIGAMSEAETKKLLAFRAKHDLELADDEITNAFSELLQTEMTSRITDLEARRLLGLARLDQADGKLAFDAKDFVTAERIAQKSIKLCKEVLGFLETTRNMAQSDSESAALVETERKAKIKEEAEKRSVTATEAMDKIEAGVALLEGAGIEIASLKIDADELNARLEKIDEALEAGEYQKVTGQLRQFLIDTDRINQIIARLKREHKVKGGNRERGGRGDRADRDDAAPAGGFLLGGAAAGGPSTFGGGPATPRTAPATVPPAVTGTPTAATGTTRTLRRPTAGTTPTATAVPAPAATPEAAPTPAVVTPAAAPGAAPVVRTLRRTPVATPEAAPVQPAPAKTPEAIPVPSVATAAPAVRTLRRTSPAPTPAAAPEAAPTPTVVAPVVAPVTTPVTRTLRRTPVTPAPEAAPATVTPTATTGGEIKIEGEDEPFAKTVTPPAETPPTSTPTPPRRSIRR